MRIGPFLFSFRPRKPGVRFVGDLVKVSLQPGDVCVLMTQTKVSGQLASQLQAYWDEKVGEDISLLVLGDGMRLGVLARDRVAADALEKASETAAVDALSAIVDTDK